MPRPTTPFDEAKRAQSKLDRLNDQRQAVLDELSNEAAAMLEALEDLRAKQTIESQLPEATAANTG